MRIICVLLLLFTLRTQAAVVAIPTVRVVSPTAPVGSPSHLATALTSFNGLSADGLARTIYLSPGNYTNDSQLVFSQNVSMQGFGRSLCTIWSSNAATLIVPGDNGYYGQFSAISLQSNGTVAVFGQSDQLTTATNVVVYDVFFSGDWDVIYCTGGFFIESAISSAQQIDFYNSVFKSRYDALYLDDGNAGIDTSPLRHRYFNCIFESVGPPLKLSSWPGEVGNIKIIGTNTIAEFLNTKFIVSGGTNLTTGIQVLSGGTVKLANPVFETSTNGLVGGAAARAEAYDILCTNTAGFVSTIFIAGASPTNRVAGNGNFIYSDRGNQASSVNATATGANTTETDLMSYTIMGSTMGSTNQAMELLAWGSFGATANSKDIRVKIGGVSILDTLPRANNAQEWVLSGTIQRVSATAMKAFMRFEVTGFVTNDLTSLTLTSATNIVLRVTGSNHTATANDIVMEGWKLKWAP